MPAAQDKDLVPAASWVLKQGNQELPTAVLQTAYVKIEPTLTFTYYNIPPNPVPIITGCSLRFVGLLLQFSRKQPVVLAGAGCRASG